MNEANHTERELLRRALAALNRTTGLQVHELGTRHVEGPLRVHLVIAVGPHTHDFDAIVKPQIDRTAALELLRMQALIDRIPRTPTLLVTEYLTPALVEYCREQIQQLFIDAAGNAYIKEDGLYVLVQGQRRAERPGQIARPRVATATAQRLIFALLCKPDLLIAPYREVAVQAGIALGAVGRVFEDLAEQKLILGGPRQWKVLQPHRLFDQWVTYFPTTLRPRLGAHRFVAQDKEWWRDANLHGTRAQWGGEVAADRLTKYLQPATCTIYAEPAYVDRTIAELATRFRWRADPRGEIEVLKRFWNFDLKQPDPDVVPPPLVYADLIAIADPRTTEVADMLRGKALEAILRTT